MKILVSEHQGEGLSWLYNNNTWTVGIKNWKPANDVAQIDCVERHLETDELFILLSGRCILLQGGESDKVMALDLVEMEAGKLYQIPAKLWHNTVTWPGTKLMIAENSNTGMHNSEIAQFDEAMTSQVRKIK